MIFSNVNIDEYKKYPAAIRKAVEFLKSNDFTAMEPGTYKIEGDDIYANVFDALTEPGAQRNPESHKEYLDVQYVVTGEEALGFTILKDKYEIAEYSQEKDLIFYKEVEDEGFIQSRPGCFCVFYPSDIHRPQCAVKEPMTIRKAVVKVKASLL